MATLYSPGNIGGLNLKNRIIMAPMGLGFCNNDQGVVNDRLIEFFRQRARGGVGLIDVGAIQVDPIRQTDLDMLKLNDDRYISGMKRLTDTVHMEDSKIIGQLLHQGRYSPSSTYGGQKAIAPSAVFSRYTGETPVELAPEEIKEVITYYEQAAKRIVESGFDGVELCTNSGYLIGQFLSPVTNLRTDRYGGHLVGRMTFLLEVIEAVRKSVGSELPIMIRIGGNDFITGGNTNTEAKEIAVALEQASVNAISVTGGWHEAFLPQVTMEVPHGAFSYLGRAIKESVSIPVIMSNRMNIPIAEKLISDGIVDYVAMARPFIADPYLVRKAQQGNYDEIRPCVGCNQGCLDLIMSHKAVECLCNAEAGREYELIQQMKLPTEIRAEKPKKVLIIGAGVAGLEYARVAACRGHKVEIWEQADSPGGQISVSAAPPGRYDFTYLGDYLTKACENAGVSFVFQTEATKESVLAAIQRDGIDHVVIATGANPISPNIPVEEGAVVVQAWDVLRKSVQTGNRVVIIGGGAVGIETAQYLAEIGTIDAETLRFLMLYRAENYEELYRLLTKGIKNVTIVEMLRSVGKDVGVSSRWSMLANLKRLNVNLVAKTKVIKIQRNDVLIETADGKHELIPADTVVMAVGSASNNKLYQELKDSVQNLTVIGDALKPAKILDSIKIAYDSAVCI